MFAILPRRAFIASNHHGAWSCVGDHARNYRSHRITAVAPEAVDADGRRSLGDMGGVAYNGQQSWIYQRCADTEDHALSEPPAKSGQDHECRNRDRLEQHPSNDQGLATEEVAGPSSGQLARSPDRG